MSDLREFLKACDEHEKQFRATFELRPEYRDKPHWEAAFEGAARYKGYADEMNLIGDVIQRKQENTSP